jgi:hypothetical protein
MARKHVSTWTAEQKEAAAAILAEYDDAPSKKPWLDAHGLSYDAISNMRRGKGLKWIELTVNGNSKPKRSQAAPATSLDDAINALEVKRDALNEVIDNLKRMR